MNVQENEHRSEKMTTPHHLEAGSILSNRNQQKSHTALNTIRSKSGAPDKSALSTALRAKAMSSLKDGLPPSPRLEDMNEEDGKELNIED